MNGWYSNGLALLSYKAAWYIVHVSFDYATTPIAESLPFKKCTLLEVCATVAQIAPSTDHHKLCED